MGLMKALSVDLIIDILKETAKCSKKEWEQAWGFEGPWTLKDMISRYSTTVTFSSSLGRSSA